MRYMILFSIIFIFFSCSDSADTETRTESAMDSISTTIVDPNRPAGTKTAKEEQVMQLISLARQTMDSIDMAYITVRSSSRLMDLSMEERENVNEALQQMNVAKELIILETQKEIIDQLRQKTSTLNSVINNIQRTSDRLDHIALTISRVSNIIEKTTNVLASGFTMGIIKPKTEGGAEN